MLTCARAWSGCCSCATTCVCEQVLICAVCVRCAVFMFECILCLHLSDRRVRVCATCVGLHWRLSMATHAFVHVCAVSTIRAYIHFTK